jgi:thiol-disulfide isomerase/thioredoxin
MTEPPADRRNDRTWLYVTLAFVIFWGIYLAFFNALSRLARPNLAPPGAPGQAEYAWRLLDLDGQPVELSRFRGKPLFLNIWATWCPPCVAEMPSIARLASRPTLKDVAFVCVSTDDSPEDVRRFLVGKNWPMTVLRATDLPPVFATDGIPATFLIAPDGRIASAQVGSADWDDPSVVALLESLVNSADKGP